MWKLMIWLPLTVKIKEATFAVILMTSDTQLRKRDREGFCDNPFHHPNTIPKVTD